MDDPSERKARIESDAKVVVAQTKMQTAATEFEA